MIKDKESAGYKLAERMSSMHDLAGEGAAKKYFYEQVAELGLVRWEALAVLDTYRELRKAGK